MMKYLKTKKTLGAKAIESPAPAGPKCAGCNKQLQRGGGFPVTLFPGLEAKVCYGRSYRQPSVVCLLRARETAARCPGCGAEDTRLGTICGECTLNIGRGRSQGARKLAWWRIIVDALGPRLHERIDDEYVAPLQQLAHVLGEALTAGRSLGGRDKESPGGWGQNREDIAGVIPEGFRKSVEYGRSESVFVELGPGQAEAIEKLLVEIRRVMRLQYGHGFNDGSSILRHLRNGDRTVGESERDIEHARKNFAPEEPVIERDDGEEDNG